MTIGFAALARTGALCLALAALAGPAAAQEKELAKLDPLDPASCDHEDGFVVVALAWVKAWDEGTKAGRIEEPRATQLATWFVGMENYLLESDDVKGTCLALIQVRKDHRF